MSEQEASHQKGRLSLYIQDPDIIRARMKNLAQRLQVLTGEFCSQSSLAYNGLQIGLDYLEAEICDQEYQRRVLAEAFPELRSEDT